jgi:hypothetical protein
MPFRHVAGTFNNDELRAMRDAYDQACAELGITLSEADKLRRELVAAVIIQLAEDGERNPVVLRRRSVLRVLNSAGRR